MKRFRSSLLGKQIAVLALVTVVSFALMASMFYLQMSDVVTSDIESEISDQCDGLDYLFRVYIASGESRLAAASVQSALERAAARNNSIIYIVDAAGSLIAAAASPESSSLQLRLLDSMSDGRTRYSFKDVRQYERAFALESGELISQTGDFFGLFKDTAHPWLSVEKRYDIERDNGDAFSYVVSVHAPMPVVQRARDALFGILLRATFISLTVCIVIGFFFSRRLTKPIKMIVEASTKIADGDFSGRISVGSNDEIGRLATAFNQMAAELGRIEDARKVFIANVSHELRTPMTTIKGFVDAILDGTAPKDGEDRYLKIVSAEADRLNRMVNSLLDLTRFESGERQINAKVFDVVDLIRRCALSFDRMMNEGEREFVDQLGEEPVYVTADEDSIEQVVINLLHNAIKFTSVGGKISASVFTDARTAYVTISDDGAGICESELESIFERFYKSDKSRAIDKTGAGLGLSIVKSVIREHRQTIAARSSLGEGAAFEFTLSLADRRDGGL